MRGYIGVDVLLQALVRRWNVIWGVHSEKYSSSTSFKTHQALKYYAVVYNTVSQEDHTTLGNHVSNKFHPPSWQLQGRHYELIYPGSADCRYLIGQCCSSTLHCVVAKICSLLGAQLSQWTFSPKCLRNTWSTCCHWLSMLATTCLY